MDHKLASIRREYSLRDLTIDSVSKSPITEFRKWLDEAILAQVFEPTAMTLATAGNEGSPSARIILLKDVSEKGLTFFTNFESRKGKQLSENPKAALVFFWPELERQVRFEGKVEKLTDSESDEYFATRPEGSKAGAWASRQSNIISSRKVLESEVKRITSHFRNKPIPRPPYWGGYNLAPVLAEFWQGRPDRLNDRIQYKLNEENQWKISRLSP
jgi:pyridoxamine 5'-phosphate oxidase